MSVFLVSLPLVLAQFMAAAWLLMFVTVVLLGLGGVMVMIYLLLPPVHRGLDGWMDGRRNDGGAVRWPAMDAQTEWFYQPQRPEPMWSTIDALQHEPVFTQEEPARANAAQGQLFDEPVR